MTLRHHFNLLAAPRPRLTGRCDGCRRWTCAPTPPDSRFRDRNGRPARLCARCADSLAGLIALDEMCRESDARATLAALMSQPPAGQPS